MKTKMTAQEKLNIISQIRLLVTKLYDDDSWIIDKILRNLDDLKDNLNKRGA